MGKAPAVLDHPDGSSTLVLPYGGRILGLYAPGSEENVLWTNAALLDTKTAAAYYTSDDWHNSGGDRTWLAPEVDFFFPKFPDTTTYFQQRALDPGMYQLTQTSQHITLENDLTVKAHRLKKEYRLSIKKAVAPAANPLRVHAAGLTEGVRYAGYTLTCTLKIQDAPKNPGYVGLWNLLQMPNGGEMLIPTYTRTEPAVFFGDIPKSDLVVEDRMVRYRMQARGEQKISIPALACTGRAGYIYDAGEESVLVVRNFRVNPSGEYVDVWSTRMDDNGFAFQACNCNSKWGSFSELEYHAPAVGGDTGQSRSTDTSVVWAFRGGRAKVEAIARQLLALNA